MAKFKLAAVFSDNMVLQKGKAINIFGEGENGKTVNVSFNGVSSSALIENNKWNVALPAFLNYAKNLILTAECDNVKLSFNNIAIGEVWFAGGQSNMEMELQNCEQGREALRLDKSNNIRYYYTPKNNVFDEKFYLDEEASGWALWGDEWNKCWSAAAYFFARKVISELGKDVTIGIIGCNWGGTKVREWLPDNSGALTLYDTMVARICPYALGGVIWYQGESDGDDLTQAGKYYASFKELILTWRENWHNDFPFLFCQLPMHRYKDQPDNKAWAVIRQAQDKVQRELDNTEMAVIIDCGEFNEIHPTNKLPVGERLALLALNRVYGLTELKAQAPRYRSHEIKENGIEISFDYAEEGFIIKNSDVIKGFEIAPENGNNEDEIYYEAEAELRGSKIFIKNPQNLNPVLTPKSARYLWTNYAEEITIYGKGSNLPLAPFNTEGETR